MAGLPGWLERLGSELTSLGERLEERRADEDMTTGPEGQQAALEHVPPPPDYAPAVAPRPDPVAAVPWEIGRAHV